MKIQNINELGVTPLRRAALEILEAGYQAIDTERAIRDTIDINPVRNEASNGINGDILKLRDKEYDLSKYERVFLIGVGKCALAASRIITELIPGRITDGVVIDVQTGTIPGVRVFQGDHPRPSARNVVAARAMLELVESATEKDLILAVISGGGSTMMCLPFDESDTLNTSDISDISDVSSVAEALEDKSWQTEAKLFTELTKAGANIEELNTVRKHTSLLRGGNLAAAANGATFISFIFSDVPGHEADFIASGPTMLDQTTIADAATVLKRHQINLPVELRETPKDSTLFARVENIMVVSNDLALRAMRIKAEELSFRVEIQTVRGSGEAREVGQATLRALRETQPNTVLLWGGETTVTIKGGGIGGRNQEATLSVLNNLRSGELVLSAASDGRDNTEAAGAICDILTRSHAESLKLSAEESLAENDSFTFFKACGDQIITGPTGSNVADFIIAINGKENFQN